AGGPQPLVLRPPRFPLECPPFHDHRQRLRLHPRLSTPPLPPLHRRQAHALRDRWRSRLRLLRHEGRHRPHHALLHGSRQHRHERHGPLLRVPLPVVQPRRQDQAPLLRPPDRRAHHPRLLPLLLREDQDPLPPRLHPAPPHVPRPARRQPPPHP